MTLMSLFTKQPLPGGTKQSQDQPRSRSPCFHSTRPQPLEPANPQRSPEFNHRWCHRHHESFSKEESCAVSTSQPGWDGARCGQLLPPSISPVAATHQCPNLGPGSAWFLYREGCTSGLEEVRCRSWGEFRAGVGPYGPTGGTMELSVSGL